MDCVFLNKIIKNFLGNWTQIYSIKQLPDSKFYWITAKEEIIACYVLRSCQLRFRMASSSSLVQPMTSFKNRPAVSGVTF